MDILEFEWRQYDSAVIPQEYYGAPTDERREAWHELWASKLTGPVQNSPCELMFELKHVQLDESAFRTKNCRLQIRRKTATGGIYQRRGMRNLFPCLKACLSLHPLPRTFLPGLDLENLGFFISNIFCSHASTALRQHALALCTPQRVGLSGSQKLDRGLFRDPQHALQRDATKLDQVPS